MNPDVYDVNIGIYPSIDNKYKINNVSLTNNNN